MGVWSGNLSYTRYFVEGEAPTQDHRSWILDRIKMMAVPTLTVETEDEQVLGWCTVENILDTEFASEKLFYNEYILWAFRLDSWRLPPTLFKALLAEAERDYRAETGKERITKREKDALKAKVRLDLKRQSLPNISTYDICWHWEKDELRFWSMSSKANTLFLELFEKTFPGLQLVAQSPYTLAERLDLGDAPLETMKSLEPETFTAIDMPRGEDS